jgi:hypothetical protein
MPTAIKKLKKSSNMDQKYECKFCGNKFHREQTLVVHMCPKKRRHLEIDTPPSRLGFRVFQRFYQLSMHGKKLRTTDEFIESPYYIDFVKFGRYLVDLKPINIDQFIDFVIKNGVKLKDWTKEFVYDQYVEDLIKKEPADSAVERSIVTMDEWAQKNKTTMGNFFKEISANEAAFLIKRGKLSPWALYLAESGDPLMQSFNEEHVKIISGMIDPSFWHKKFKSKSDDVDFIADVLKAAGL